MPFAQSRSDSSANCLCACASPCAPLRDRLPVTTGCGGACAAGCRPCGTAVSAPLRLFTVLVHRLATFSWHCPHSFDTILAGCLASLNSFPGSVASPSWLQMVVSSFHVLVFPQGTRTPFTTCPCWAHARRWCTTGYPPRVEMTLLTTTPNPVAERRSRKPAPHLDVRK